MSKDENKFSNASDSGLRELLEEIDRERKFSKTIIGKMSHGLLIIAIIGMLSTFIIGKNQLGFNVGFISILLLGAYLIIVLMFTAVMPFINKTYVSYRKEHLSKKMNKSLSDFFLVIF